MTILIENIDKYLTAQERKDAISLSYEFNGNLEKAIEMVRNSKERDKIISIFSTDIQEEIKKLIDGGIL